MYNKKQIEQAVKSKGYKWFDKKYELNIVGIRNSIPGSKVTNVFDDFITLSYNEDDKGECDYFFSWMATTDPGKKAVLEFSNSRGVAILKPGQYLDAYIIRLHANKYRAVCQDKPVKVFRDKNKDMKFDMDPSTINEGLFGINIHRSNPKTESYAVENWSEGCQVFKRVKDFDLFMEICTKASQVNGNRFTYTLIESRDII